MALTTNTQNRSAGVVNHATGHVVTDAGAAADTTFTTGFKPKIVRFYNITDSISYEWFEGMAAVSAQKNILDGTRSLNTTEGVTVSDTGFMIKAAAIPASKTCCWEAIGG
jgi:hypothetical protein